MLVCLCLQILQYRTKTAQHLTHEVRPGHIWQLQLCSLAKPIKFDFPMNITCVQHALQYFYSTIKRFCVDYSRGSLTSHSHLKFWVCKTPSSYEALKGCVWSLWPLFSFCRVGLRVGMGAGGLWKASYHHTHPIPPSPKGKPETVLLKCDAFAVKFNVISKW